MPVGTANESCWTVKWGVLGRAASTPKAASMRESWRRAVCFCMVFSKRFPQFRGQESWTGTVAGGREVMKPSNEMNLAERLVQRNCL